VGDGEREGRRAALLGHGVEGTVDPLPSVTRSASGMSSFSETKSIVIGAASSFMVSTFRSSRPQCYASRYARIA
jgi:hypothetical protein